MHKLIIAGGTGFLGTLLVQHFKVQFKEIVLLSRKRTPPEDNVRTVLWDATSFSGWERELENASAVINMTGKSVDCRYHQKNKDLILNSRVNSTKILGKAIANCIHPPKVWLNSSTATIYRHAMDKVMDEYTGEIGTGFSVKVATAWEKAFFNSATPETRKVALRTAIVLGKNGGALQPIKQITKLGLGGKQGRGDQKFSWIHEEDFVRSLAFILNNRTLRGPINIVAPQPSDNKSLMKGMRNLLGVPFGIPASKPVLEIGAFLIRTETELLLKSRNVVPKVLQESGFDFKYDCLETALEDLLV